MTMRIKVGRSVEVSFKEGVEKVSDESVRPCAPSLPSTDSMDWVVGDVVELFDSGYWEDFVISQVLGKDCYLIREFGSFREFRVEKSNTSIRMQHEWKDNEWFSLGKNPENGEDLMIRIRKKARMQQEADLKKVQPISNDCPKSSTEPLSSIPYCAEDYSEFTKRQSSVNKKAKCDAIHSASYSSIEKENSCGDFKMQPIANDSPKSSKRSFSSIPYCAEDYSECTQKRRSVNKKAKRDKSADCDLMRHGSLIAAFIMMMSWLSTSSLVSQEKDIICSCFFADKAINV